MGISDPLPASSGKTKPAAGRATGSTSSVALAKQDVERLSVKAINQEVCVLARQEPVAVVQVSDGHLIARVHEKIRRGSTGR
jgi:hypothetical protein